MGRYRAKRRKSQINARQGRKIKLASLREAFSNAQSADDKAKIMEKVGKISPWLSKEEFLTPGKSKSVSKKVDK
jgi:hypothetical protein